MRRRVCIPKNTQNRMNGETSPDQQVPGAYIMIHPTDPSAAITDNATASTPARPAVRPQVLNLPSSASVAVAGPSLAGTVLDLSNPLVVTSLAAAPSPLLTEKFLFTPNTEMRLMTSITDAISSQQGLLDNLAVTPVTMVTAATTQPMLPETVSAATAELETVSPASAQINEGNFNTMDSSTMDSGSMSDETCSTVDPVEVIIVEDSDLDPAVARATRDSLSCGKLTPLIKTELKFTIQQKRQLEGKPDVDPEELLATKDTSNEQMSTEDLEKRKRRRERNKLAAQRCREKRRSLAQTLESESAELEEVNKTLRSEIEALEKEKEKLKRILQFHDDRHVRCPKKLKISVSSDVEEDDDDDLSIDFLGEEGLELNENSIQIVLGKK